MRYKPAKESTGHKGAEDSAGHKGAEESPGHHSSVPPACLRGMSLGLVFSFFFLSCGKQLFACNEVYTWPQACPSLSLLQNKSSVARSPFPAHNKSSIVHVRCKNSQPVCSDVITCSHLDFPLTQLPISRF